MTVLNGSHFKIIIFNRPVKLANTGIADIGRFGRRFFIYQQNLQKATSVTFLGIFLFGYG